jgi:PAS domain S-box-containing protein
VPFHRQGRWTRLLSLIDERPRAWRDDEVALFRELAMRVFPRVERARAETLLRDSERRFRLMADGTPLMIWVLDPDGRLEFVNAAHRAFFGMDEAHVPSTDWQPLIHEDDVAACLDAVARARETGSTFRTRARVRRADGAWRWIDSHGVPRITEDGRLEGFVGSSIDLTELIEGERTLQEADRRKDAFLATLSHELRNPLAPLRNATRLIARHDLPEPARRALGICERQIRHIARLVDDLLEMSRITRGKLELSVERVVVQQAVAALAEAMADEFDARGQRLDLELEPEPIDVDADPVRFTQILENLLSNASKYTDRGGRVTLRARRTGDEVVVEVSDTGIGIAPDDLSRLFEPFTQIESSLARAQGGLGIGLALVRQLVDLHGGRVSAASAGPGRGSTFTVVLPRARA